MPKPEESAAAVPEHATMSLVPRAPDTQASETPSQMRDSLSDADWHLLFDAVLCRLRDVARFPATAAAVLPECIEALDSLQRVVDTRPLRRR